MGSDFTPTLLEAIDADFLPDFLGGNCNCQGFGGDCMMSDIGPWLDYELVSPKGIRHKSLRYE